jgi:hypothetical protein
VSTHLYCLVLRDARVPLPVGLLGIDAAPVRSLATDGIVAWVSDATPRAKPTYEGIRAHDAVVQAALDTGTTPAPVRFAHQFESDDACRQELDRVADALAAMLTGLQGFVEMTLILTPSTKRMLSDLEPVIPQLHSEQAGAGRQYLETLRAREAASAAVRRAMDPLADQLTRAAAPFVRRSTTHAEQFRMPMRTISHLVGREQIEPYRQAIQGVRGGADCRFLVVGPRPPYSFCGLGGASDGHHGIKLAD